MRSFGMLRISMIVLGFAAAMFIAPQCRAQFEIDPDHFDGTDSWQAAALAKVHVRKTNRASAGVGIWRDWPAAYTLDAYGESADGSILVVASPQKAGLVCAHPR